MSASPHLQVGCSIYEAHSIESLWIIHKSNTSLRFLRVYVSLAELKYLTSAAILALEVHSVNPVLALVNNADGQFLFSPSC